MPPLQDTPINTTSKMTRLPETKEEILATGVVDPEFDAEFKARPHPLSSVSLPLTQLKEMVTEALPLLQEQLQQSRPLNIKETEYHIPMRESTICRLIVCHKSVDLLPPSCPLVVLFHGGGHCVGYPELELDLARRLAFDSNAVVTLPTYRLAPEDPFPASVFDAWDIVQYLAAESGKPHNPAVAVLPPQCDPAGEGFIVAGTSAGAHLAAVVAHLARERGLQPRLTGQMLFCGVFLSRDQIPKRYASSYLAQEQNKHAPCLSQDFLDRMAAAYNGDHNSLLWAVVDREHLQNQNSGGNGDVQVNFGYSGLAPAYLQIGGMDPARDDSLIYERILRQENNIPTKVDLYSGFPHCWWSQYPSLEATKKREDDTVRGLEWLLQKKAGQ
ncbi:Alpha/Beta hydrolase protein [Xylariales sp. PMI_506]|nr:Alpha/Beta hydrolase protein [Xylariales sp. PMI_506]